MVSRRSKVLKASVTEQEMLSVRHAAKKNGVSVSEFIRRLLQPTFDAGGSWFLVKVATTPVRSGTPVSDMRPLLRSFLAANGWQESPNAGRSGEHWIKPGIEWAVPVPKSLPDDGGDWDLVLGRLARILGAAPKDVEAAIRADVGDDQ